MLDHSSRRSQSCLPAIAWRSDDSPRPSVPNCTVRISRPDCFRNSDSWLLRLRRLPAAAPTDGRDPWSPTETPDPLLASVPELIVTELSVLPTTRTCVAAKPMLSRL